MLQQPLLQELDNVLHNKMPQKVYRLLELVE